MNALPPVKGTASGSTLQPMCVSTSTGSTAALLVPAGPGARDWQAPHLLQHCLQVAKPEPLLYLNNVCQIHIQPTYYFFSK